MASRVVPFFRVAATKLLESVASRVDCDEAVNLKKKKILTNGANECRVRTTARVKHMTYGRGFRVEVVEGVVHQNVFFFTKQELSPVQWHQHVVDALEASGGHVLLAAASETGEKDVGGEVSNGTKGVLPKTKAQQEDDDWVHTLMTGCLVGDACLEKTVEAVTPVQAEERPVSREAPRTETPVGAKGKVKDKATPPTVRTGPAGQHPLKNKIPFAPTRSVRHDRDFEVLRNDRRPPVGGKPPTSQSVPAHGAQLQNRWGPRDQRQSPQTSQAAPEATEADARISSDPRVGAYAEWGDEQTGLMPKFTFQGPRSTGSQEPPPQETSWKSWSFDKRGSWDQSEWNQRGWDQGAWNQRDWDEGVWVQESWQQGAYAWGPALDKHTTGTAKVGPPCDQCGRRLHLWHDNGGWFCRACWVSYYNTEPPHK